MKIKFYKDLIIWQRGIDLVKEIYLLTKNFPREEIYGLTSQIKRASISIPSNIAEGQARRSTREFQQFLSYAYGSLAEVDTQLIIADRLGFTNERQIKNSVGIVAECQRMITSLTKKLSY